MIFFMVVCLWQRLLTHHHIDRLQLIFYILLIKIQRQHFNIIYEGQFQPCILFFCSPPYAKIIRPESDSDVHYEKTLPYGSVFSLSTHDNKKQNMSGRASVVIVVFIHKTDRCIFINQVINLKQKLVSYLLISTNAKIVMTKGH